MSEPKKKENGEWVPDVKDAEVYRFLTTYWLYQDKMGWGRIRGLITVEAGALAAAIAKKGVVGIGALVLATIFCIFIRRLIQRDFQIRDQDLKALDQVHIPRGIVMEIQSPSRWSNGYFVLAFLFWTILLVNIALAVLLVFELVRGESYL